MHLSNLIEQFLLTDGPTTVRTLARRFGISEPRCLEEVSAIVPFGVEMTTDGRVRVRSEVRRG